MFQPNSVTSAGNLFGVLELNLREGAYDWAFLPTAGFSYSDGMKGHGGVWNLETLSAFLESPKTYVAGTKMSFNGLAKAEDRVNLIVYLNEAGGAPVPLAE